MYELITGGGGRKLDVVTVEEVERLLVVTRVGKTDAEDPGVEEDVVVAYTEVDPVIMTLVEGVAELAEELLLVV